MTATPHTRFSDYLTALRPRQWLKNGVVLAAYFFALGDKNQSLPVAAFFTSLTAALLFTLAASGVYLFNDLRDRDLDRAHPVKCRRPIADGRVSPSTAVILGSLLITSGLWGAWLLSPPLAFTLAGYTVLQAAYTLFLKQIHLVDVFVIAFGFVLRALAGGLAIDVYISPWLIICTFLIALFLALCKRRHEMQLVSENDDFRVRPSLSKSNSLLLDQLIAVTACAVIVSYSIYTQWPETVAKFETNKLYYTIPFVVFGIFRYLDRVYLHKRGGEPESVLLTDIPLLINIVLFAFTVLAVTRR